LIYIADFICSKKRSRTRSVQ